MRLTRTTALALVWITFFSVLLTGLSTVQHRMNTIRTEHELTETRIEENAPPMVVLAQVALGSFRGLIADYLWLRSNRMQEQGNYFEMVQLASWIVKLQPRFTAATAFLAWNMSYNISVTFSSFEDRWRWVRRGIELIRDEALNYNPGDPELMRELGWIYQHKLGKDLDDANRYYKTQLALDMMKALGGYPPDWEGLAAAPRTETALREAIGDDAEFWTLLEISGFDFRGFETEFRRQGDFPDEMAEQITDRHAARVVELCLRTRWLQQGLKLDPALIVEINDRHGPLDWRLPEAHAVYWATRGLKVAKDELWLSCDRMVFQSLAAAFKSGRLVYIKDIDHLEMTPNIALVDTANQAYLDAFGKHGEQTIKGAYMNFLVDAVVILYQFGQRSKARTFFDQGRERFPSRFEGNLDDFVLHELALDMALASQPQAQGAVQAYLLQACQALALGEHDRAVGFERIAQKLWQKYMREIGESTHRRRRLPPYEQMKRNAVRQAMELFPPEARTRLQQQLGTAGRDLGFADAGADSDAPEARD